MSELSDTLEALTKDLPHGVRKVIDKAIDGGWELNPPGITMVMRLNHPTDLFADPVYVAWTVGRTPTGKPSYKFSSAGTKGLKPLSGPDLLEYLEEPTVAHSTVAELEDEYAERHKPKWDDSKSPESNAAAILGAEVLSVDFGGKVAQNRSKGRTDPTEGSPTSSPLRLSLTSPQSSTTTVPTSLTTDLAAGDPAGAPSMTTARPLRVSIPQASVSAATDAG